MPQGVGLRVGIYLDVENIKRNGGRGLRFDVLRAFACRQGGTPIRLNAYLAYDEQRAISDGDYRERAKDYQDALREDGFKVLRKPVQWFKNDDGTVVSKANADLDMAVDMLLQSEQLDRIVLATGDGDFTQVVRALQNRGCRVELVAFDNVSSLLRQEVDFFQSGYLVPGLQPAMLVVSDEKKWGELGSRVRGTCYHYNHEKGFGFLRFMTTLEADLFQTDSRSTGSPFSTVFFHMSALPSDVKPDDLPNRDIVFEFTISTEKPTGDKPRAADLRLVTRY